MHEFNRELKDGAEISEYLLKLRSEKSPCLQSSVTFYTLEWLVTWDGTSYNVRKSEADQGSLFSSSADNDG